MVGGASMCVGLSTWNGYLASSSVAVPEQSTVGKQAPSDHITQMQSALHTYCTIVRTQCKCTLSPTHDHPPNDWSTSVNDTQVRILVPHYCIGDEVDDDNAVWLVGLMIKIMLTMMTKVALMWVRRWCQRSRPTFASGLASRPSSPVGGSHPPSLWLN